MAQKIAIFWFRRDLRVADNAGLYHALDSGHPVLPLFIFDSNILDSLEDRDDKRVQFIHDALSELHQTFQESGGTLLAQHGDPVKVWPELLEQYEVAAVYTNRDYEPYAAQRDDYVAGLLKSRNIPFHTYKDQVIFEKREVLTGAEKPYTVFTPYSRTWRQKLTSEAVTSFGSEKLLKNLLQCPALDMPKLSEMGFESVEADFPPATLREEIIEKYDEQRDFPAIDGTSRLSVHLRFGTVSIRKLVRKALELNDTWLSELIWRDFFMMILDNFPHVVDQPFKSKYAAVPWRDAPKEFQAWCDGKTGYPMVDAGMRELNETGFMHNRVRMVTAGFLTKHLLIDWRLGERYFARKLLDYDLSANNGNWQWAAGCGCDAAPYFRIFNPTTQIKKFDPDHRYLKKWIPELDTPDYPAPIVEHKFGRERALERYKSALE